MTAVVFVDTNIFAYARQSVDARKRALAMDWIERLWHERIGRTSMQVLCEYFAVLTRKSEPRYDSAEAWDQVLGLLAWDPPPIDAQVLARAFEIEQRHRLNWWDCLIVSSAQQQGCSILLTEDLQDRAVFGGVTVRNPFVLGVSDDLAAYDTNPAAPAYPRRGRPRGVRGRSPRTAAVD